MSAPKLNRRLVLEVPERVIDGAGGFTENWVPLGTLWAKVTARSGRETSGEETRLSRTGFRILVRATPHGAPSRPSADQRFRDGARIFKIVSVAEYDQEGRYLTCLANEEVVT